MPRKIENPVEDGISSKVYILIYINGPISGYKIAKMVYGHPTYTNRIYEAKDKINKAFPGAIKETSKGYMLSNRVLFNLIVRSISESLKIRGDKLSKTEEAEIEKILESDDFKNFARIEATSLLDSGEMKNVNALEFLLNLLFRICLVNVNLELATKGKIPIAKVKKSLVKTRMIREEDMKSFVELITSVSSGLVLKILSLHSLFLEYALNISEMMKK